MGRLQPCWLMGWQSVCRWRMVGQGVTALMPPVKAVSASFVARLGWR